MSGSLIRSDGLIVLMDSSLKYELIVCGLVSLNLNR